MEVHKHPHHVTHKKKWTEYLLEFFMLFLAVFLGFTAENIRENITSKEHAKLLTNRLVKDLKKDTLNLGRSIRFESVTAQKIDTLFLELQKPMANANLKAIQQLIVDNYRISIFGPSTGAMAAIKNELNIKQFAESDLPDLFAEYESRTDVNKKVEDIVSQLIEQNLLAFFYQHFTPATAASVFSNNASVPDGEVRNLTQEDMKELSVKMEVLKGMVTSLVGSETDLKGKAENLIKYTVNHYHLTQE